MSIHNNNSLLIKSVSHSNRFLNSNINNLNGIGMTTNNNRKMPKAMSNFSSSNISVNSYSNSYSNPSQSQTYLPSMIKNMPTTNANKKYAADYQQAVRFDYADAFLNNTNIDFLNRISQMQRLQMETVEWERKRRLSKKKSTNNGTNTTSNNSLTSKTANNSGPNNTTNSTTTTTTGTSNGNLLVNSTNLNINLND